MYINYNDKVCFYFLSTRTKLWFEVHVISHLKKKYITTSLILDSDVKHHLFFVKDLVHRVNFYEMKRKLVKYH